MGFDILYVPPVHPIGTNFRKGKNNSLTPTSADPGVPWAIGNKEGGHDAINPALGLGSFLAQALLRKPLMAANTREFHVTGPWADPKVDKIDRKAADEAPAGAQPAASAPGAEIQRVRP